MDKVSRLHFPSPFLYPLPIPIPGLAPPIRLHPPSPNQASSFLLVSFRSVPIPDCFSPPRILSPRIFPSSLSKRRDRFYDRSVVSYRYIRIRRNSRNCEETVCWNMDIIRISRGLNSNYREISFLSFSLFDYFSKIASPKFKVNCEIDFRSLLNAFGLASSCKSNVLYNFNNVSTIY